MSDNGLLHTAAIEGRQTDIAWLDSVGRETTYRELNERADLLAERLIGAGAGRGERVGLYLERGADMAVAVLGVLRAGAAFVPLGLTEPAARLSRILSDCAPVIVVTQDAATSRFDHDGPDTLDMHGDDHGGSGAREADAAVPSDPAYVIYTSGSSGTPKGVVVEHRNLVPHLDWLAERMPLATGDRLLQVAPYTFDASLTDFFWPLRAGATVVSLAEGEHLDPFAIAAALVEKQITAVRLPPAILPLLLEEPRLHEAKRLRYVISGGDRLPASIARRITEVLPSATVYNRYGPTETAVAVAYHEFDAATDRTSDVPIGHAITGAELSVSPEGELLIGGDCVARGYLGDDELSSERFVRLPDLGRVFRSGDRVRRNVGGQFEFMGRDDEQVQINGHRVEIGEVHAALLSHPEVDDCAIVQRADQALAAFVVTAHDQVSVERIREHLRDGLPGHMVPGVITVVPRLPTTDRGKVDLAALRAVHAAPVPAPATAPISVETGASGDPVRETVARVWSTLLGGVELHDDDDFFERGGHSVLAVRAASRIRRELGLRVPPRMMFEKPTLGEFTAAVAEIVATTGEPKSSPG